MKTTLKMGQEIKILFNDTDKKKQTVTISVFHMEHRVNNNERIDT